MTTTLEVAARAASPVGGWAEVRADDHITRYMRYGARIGARVPVVILVSATLESNLWPELFERLWEQQRIYIPDLPDDEASFVPRLRAFLDGLGIPRATLIAPGSFTNAAVEFGLRESDRIHRLVVAPQHFEEMVIAEDLVGSALSVAGAVLVLRRNLCACEAIEAVAAFVGGGESG